MYVVCRYDVIAFIYQKSMFMTSFMITVKWLWRQKFIFVKVWLWYRFRYPQSQLPMTPVSFLLQRYRFFYRGIFLLLQRYLSYYRGIFPPGASTITLDRLIIKFWTQLGSECHLGLIWPNLDDKFAIPGCDLVMMRLIPSHPSLG